MKRKLADDHSGQTLIITALVITLLLMSTVYYVFEAKRAITKNQTNMATTFLSTKVSTLNTVTSALANTSNGGMRGVLATDLNELSSVVGNHSYDGECSLLFNLLNTFPYENGTWISWGSDGSGISSAYVTFGLDFSGPSATFNSEYWTNITTALTIEGTYAANGTEKTVDLTCRIYNEEEPALANDITLLYQNETGGPWSVVDQSNKPNTLDYHNGTYLVSFNVQTQSSLQVSAQVHDLRDIFVVANTTCAETQT